MPSRAFVVYPLAMEEKRAAVYGEGSNALAGICCLSIDDECAHLARHDVVAMPSRAFVVYPLSIRITTLKCETCSNALAGICCLSIQRTKNLKTRLGL